MPEINKETELSTDRIMSNRRIKKKSSGKENKAESTFQMKAVHQFKEISYDQLP